MDEFFDVRIVSLEYLGGGLLFIQVEFYYQARKWRLNTLFQSGHIRHEITEIYEVGYRRVLSNEDDDYLMDNKKEVFKKLKF